MHDDTAQHDRIPRFAPASRLLPVRFRRALETHALGPVSIAGGEIDAPRYDASNDADPERNDDAGDEGFAGKQGSHARLLGGGTG